MSLQVLGITLAKGHSKGVPGKNTKEIAGKPLLSWTTREAKRSYQLNDYFVSTDDTHIAWLSTRMGVETVIRPASLARDDTPSLAAIRHAVDVIEHKKGYSFQAIALIPCTTPLRTADDIDGAISMLEDNPMADSVIGVTECIPVERVKKIVDGLIVDTYPEPQDGQRQNLEKCYTRSGIYVIRRDSLDRLFGHANSLAYVIPPERAVNIDTILDWTLAEALLKEREGLP